MTILLIILLSGSCLMLLLMLVADWLTHSDDNTVTGTASAHAPHCSWWSQANEAGECNCRVLYVMDGGARSRPIDVQQYVTRKAQGRWSDES